MEQPPKSPSEDKPLETGQFRCGACGHVWDTNYPYCPECNGYGKTDAAVKSDPEG